MMTSPLRIGLIGCGHVGRIVHLNNLRRLPKVEVAALAESDAQRRETAQRENPGVEVHIDYRELLARKDIDAVVICLPSALHARSAIAALQSGKHVYLEKPLATNLQDGGEALAAWRRSGKVAMIGFNYRFNPLNQEMRELLRVNRIGELLGARSVFSSAPHRMAPWKQTRETGGGVLLDLGSHHMDLIRFWFEQAAVEVRASVRSQRVEADTAMVEVRLASGLLVQSFFLMSSVDDDQFEIYGRTGKLSVNRYSSWNVAYRGVNLAALPLRYLRRLLESVPRSQFALRKLRAPSHEPSYAAALAHFVRAAQTGRQASPNFEDGFHSLAAIIAAEESARTGRSVAVSPLPE